LPLWIKLFFSTTSVAYGDCKVLEKTCIQLERKLEKNELARKRKASAHLAL
jgi:hypothetical protein